MKSGCLALAVAVVVFTASCDFAAAARQAQPSVPTGASNSQNVSPQIKREIGAIVAAGNLPGLNWPNFDERRADVNEFYANSNGAPAWVGGTGLTVQARAMIERLKTADRAGLDPEDYDASRWDSRVAELSYGRAASETVIAGFDVALTVSALRYISDLQSGRINPQSVHFAFGTKAAPIGLGEFVQREIAEGSTLDSAISNVEPPFPTYRRTLKALETYIDLAHADSGAPLPSPPKPVKVGDLYDGLPRLQSLLARLGDLPAASIRTPAPSAYGDALVDAVKHFQQRHGLQPDGLIGPQTVKELNTPLSQRIRQLDLTLERWRWAPREFERPPIVVNIPEFQVRATDEQYHWVRSMKVVVGQAYGHQTPVFASAINSVIFRPYWDVPYSITRKELLPKIKKDPNFLTANSYELVDRNGRVLSSQTVNADVEAQLRSGSLRIRQRPGPNNALGLLKFDFPNPYDVYMHGTPATELFARSRRDFSHGCIRVEDPVALATWVLQDSPEWTLDRIQQAMNGDETVRVAIKRPIPVLVVYGTAVVMEDGEVRFFDDLYGGDAALQQALTSREARRGN